MTQRDFLIGDTIRLKSGLLTKVIDVFFYEKVVMTEAGIFPVNAVERIEKKARYTKGWTSIRDSLPEKSGHYIVARNFEVTVLEYSDEHKKFNTKDSMTTEEAEMFGIMVQWWQPLPDTPELIIEKENE